MNSILPTPSVQEDASSKGALFSLAPNALFLLATLFCLTPWSSAPIALTLGMALALTVGSPYQSVGKKWSKTLLQTCVVLLGFGMDLSTVLRAGAHGLIFAAATIAATFALGAVLGRWLQVRRVTSTLISAGTAICGGSAIAAIGSVLGAPEADMSVALATVFLLNAVALYAFPPLGHLLGLSQVQFGTWAGVAIHDISSVVGASSRYGLLAMQTATAVKLSRALWIAPVSLVVGATCVAESGTGGKARRAPVPVFIGLFLVASVMRTILPGISGVAPVLSRVSTAGLSVTLFLIGAGLSRKTLKAVGWKPMLQGILVWLFVAAASLYVIAHTIS